MQPLGCELPNCRRAALTPDGCGPLAGMSRFGPQLRRLAGRLASSKSVTAARITSVSQPGETAASLSSLLAPSLFSRIRFSPTMTVLLVPSLIPTRVTDPLPVGTTTPIWRTAVGVGRC